MKDPVSLVKTGPAKSPREVVERTRRLFAMRGTWVRGSYQGTSKIWTTRRCLISGLQACDGVHAKAAEKAVLKSINETFGKKEGTYASIPGFNDKAYRKKEDIIRVLDHTLEKGGL